ncbi:hypothetical protein [Streptomyces sp. NPDC000229]|uniref:hypothetical protein n=1 Tax=Streptomyces sp. NPDC000229 TaxID=3154247 RepID=UPI003317A2EF
MPCAGSRWCRVAAAVLVLVGTLLVCGPGAAAEEGAAVVAVSAAEAAGPGPGQAPGQGPGCGSSDDGGGLAPAVPPRSGTLCELLPALHVARAVTGPWGVDETILDVRPERGPPPLAPPSPLDLSILRV